MDEISKIAARIVIPRKIAEQDKENWKSIARSWSTLALVRGREAKVGADVLKEGDLRTLGSTVQRNGECNSEVKNGVCR